jgi:glutamate/aspartate transport system substrate-binding protein
MKILLIAGAFVTLNIAAGAASADTLSKLAESKKLVVGARESGAPLSYTLGGGRFAGYHVELCERVIAGLKKSLKLPELEVVYQPVTSSNRIPLVQNGTVDLECGTTSNTAARQAQVAFAVTTFVTEVRMAVNAKSGITSVAQLGGKTVAATTGSTAVKTVRLQKRAASVDFQELYGKDTADAFLLLESGRADAMVDDDNILMGLIASSKAPKDFKIVGETLSIEPIAIMLRKDDPAFKQAIDAQLTMLIRSGDLEAIYRKWFLEPIAPKGISLNLPMSESLKAAIAKPNDNPAEAYQAK